jgi:hypothetical protein
MWVNGGVSTSTQPAQINFAVIRNGQTGTTYGFDTITADVNGRLFSFATCIYIPDVVYNDYFELMFQSTAAESVVLTNLNWLTETR